MLLCCLAACACVTNREGRGSKLTCTVRVAYINGFKGLRLAVQRAVCPEEWSSPQGLSLMAACVPCENPCSPPITRPYPPRASALRCPAVPRSRRLPADPPEPGWLCFVRVQRRAHVAGLGASGGVQRGPFQPCADDEALVAWSDAARASRGHLWDWDQSALRVVRTMAAYGR